MKKSLAALAAAFCLTLAPAAYGADAETQLNGLVAKVQTKLKAGKSSEADLAPELKEFDALLAEHKDEKTNEVASILLMKAMLYAQVFEDNEKAAAGFQQLKTDFPATDPGRQADDFLATLARQAAALKIQSTLKPGSAFPDFQVNDLDGKPLSVSAHKGKVVLVDFWATWCVPCVRELPNVIKVYNEYHDKGFDIIGVSLDQDKAKLTAFIQEKKVVWPQYFDGKGWENAVATTYGVNTVPATYLLDKEGKILGKGLSGDALENAVKTALSAK